MVLVLHRAPKKGMFVLLILLAIVLSCNANSYARHCYRESDRNAAYESDETENSGSPRKSIVTMPSGLKYRIPNPKVSMNTDCDNADLVEVDSARKEFKVIEKEMRTQFRINKTIRIQKIINSCLWSRYTYYRNRISQESDAGANETYLFSTSLNNENWPEVPNKGYDERLAKSYSGLPSGLYFHNQRWEREQIGNGGRGYYINRVALGKVYYLDTYKDMAQPPMGYHTVSMVSANSTQVTYAIPRGEQIYPEYIVEVKIEN